jgi:hypothetical protein
MRKTPFSAAKPSGPNLFYIPSHFPLRHKREKSLIKDLSRRGACRRLPSELARVFIRFADPSQVPSTGSPDIGALAHSDGFSSSFL